jgi:hypothetical protein
MVNVFTYEHFALKCEQNVLDCEQNVLDRETFLENPNIRVLVRGAFVLECKENVPDRGVLRESPALRVPKCGAHVQAVGVVEMKCGGNVLKSD